MTSHYPGAPRPADIMPTRDNWTDRDARLVQPSPCCSVRATLSIGLPREVPPGDPKWGALWEARTPLEFADARCKDGLLSLNFVSFQTSSGDYITTTRAIEIFLVGSSADKTARQDVWSIPLFVGTVASFFEQYEGGFPVPLEVGASEGGARMALRTRVAVGANEPWAFLAGVMLTAQNSF